MRYLTLLFFFIFNSLDGYSQFASIGSINSAVVCPNNGVEFSGYYKLQNTYFDSIPHLHEEFGSIRSIVLLNNDKFLLNQQDELIVQGENTQGYLGTGDTLPIWPPIAHPTLNQVSQVSLFSFSTILCVAGSNKELYAWGKNTLNIFDSTSISESNTPIKLHSFSNIKQVSSSRNHYLVLLEDGTVWGWGKNEINQISDSAISFIHNPLPIQHLPNNVAFIETGELNSFAVTENGEVYAWGINDFGQTGIHPDSSQIISTPTVVPQVSNIIQVASNRHFTFFLDKNGQIWSVGSNLTRLLVQPTDMVFPAEVIPNLPFITEMVLENDAIMAKSDNNEVYAWGNNGVGKLGVGHLSSPIETPELYQSNCTSTAINDLKPSKTSIFPNPSSNGYFNLTTPEKNKAWKVLTMNGQHIASGNSSLINLSNAPSGIYQLILVKTGQHQLIIVE